MKNNKLFLDDIRIPKEAINLVPNGFNDFYLQNDWDIVRNYDEFVLHIEMNGVPEFVSFDHDLADFHYKLEKTGLDCAKFLVEYCADENLQLPQYLVHSANPSGKENIEKFLENAKKHLNI